DRPAAHALPAERVAFIQRTYLHVAGAILAFAGLVAILLPLPVTESFVASLYGTGKLGMFALMIAFIVGGYVARWWAHSATSAATQYAGLALYVILEVVIFLPMLWFADKYFAGQHLIAKSGLITLGLTAGLTMAVFLTGKDFSFLRPIICIA